MSRTTDTFTIKVDAKEAAEVVERHRAACSYAARGMKFDGGKPRFDLLEFGCPDALLGVVKVMTWAIEVKGYEPHSWQGVEDAYTRYTAAIRRHQNAKARGETHDPESGFPHDWHIATNALFLAQIQHNADAT